MDRTQHGLRAHAHDSIAVTHAHFLGRRRWLARTSLAALHSLLLADTTDGRGARLRELVPSPSSVVPSPLVLPRLPSLTALSLRGSRTLSDAGLAALLRPLSPTLVTLCLSGCASVGEG